MDTADVGDERAYLRSTDVDANYDLVACDRDTSAPRPWCILIIL